MLKFFITLSYPLQFRRGHTTFWMADILKFAINFIKLLVRQSGPLILITNQKAEKLYSLLYSDI